MADSPKCLSDLASMEADVRITCRQCRFEDDWTHADLARHLAAIGGSQAWPEITRHLRCRRAGCGSTDLRALPVPYARRPANMPRRVGQLDAQLLDLAMTILEQAVARSRGQAVNTTEVRLALFVVHRYMRDPALARVFWMRASASHRTVNDGLSEPLNQIRDRLVRGGWLPPPVNLSPVKTWPWSSPAPPGWLAPPGSQHQLPSDDRDITETG